MARSVVATGRRMNNAEMFKVCPPPYLQACLQTDPAACCDCASAACARPCVSKNR